MEPVQPANSKGKKILIVVGVVVALVVLAISAKLLAKLPNSATPPSISPDILSLTQPVNAISGTVEAINGNVMTVSDPKKVTFNVVITDKTIINKQPGAVVYFFKTNPLADPAKLKATIQDIKVGDQVSAISGTDLRTVVGNRFEADTFNIIPVTSVINGRISEINDKTITLKADKTYTVTVSSDTEISRAPSGDSSKSNKPLQFSLSDLKKDMLVNVYAQGDSTKTTNLTALKIEPVPENNSTTPTTTASPSAKKSNSSPTP